MIWLRGKGILLKLRVVTISNTYKMYEETGHSQATNLTLIFHPAIITKGLSREEQKEIPDRVKALLTESVKSLQILKK